ncbi:MAG TPA: hypothetical protein VJN94_07145 [Candidatus Binataceae bacterium]|nr:hypothetical protein [Candidatus Binataceae bacterium]
MKRRTIKYPPAMRTALITRHMFDAGFELEIAVKPAGRGDVPYVAACASRVIGFLVLVLYALNRCYFINEKGSFAESKDFELLPAGFHADARDILAHLGGDPDALRVTLARLEALVEAVRNLSSHQDANAS